MNKKVSEEVGITQAETLAKLVKEIGIWKMEHENSGEYPPRKVKIDRRAIQGALLHLGFLQNSDSNEKDNK